MDYNKFVSKWNGKPLDYDHAFSTQCTDVMRAFVNEVYKLNPYIAIPTTGSAKNIFYNFKDNKYFKKVLNTPNGIPKQGDILFFKTSTWFPFLFGRDGHVCLVDKADLYNLQVFQQNYPTGRLCGFGKFKYKDVIGWLVKK